ncbi:hypothetical protein, partial [Baaleninema sp.]|uniref:hypothetical protein n=1 Tax=Baaleninema sp. TaxID=3101197 RepID=UPI003D07C6F2
PDPNPDPDPINPDPILGEDGVEETSIAPEGALGGEVEGSIDPLTNPDPQARQTLAIAEGVGEIEAIAPEAIPLESGEGSETHVAMLDGRILEDFENIEDRPLFEESSLISSRTLPLIAKI